MKKQFLIFLFSIVLLGCRSDDSEDCGATGFPPAQLSFNLVDASTGENVFSSGIWQGTDGITITDIGSAQELDFELVLLNGNMLLHLQLPYDERDYTYSFRRNNETVFTIKFTIVSENRQCYVKTSATNIQVTNAGLEILGNNTVKIAI